MLVLSDGVYGKNFDNSSGRFDTAVWRTDRHLYSIQSYNN